MRRLRRAAVRHEWLLATSLLAETSALLSDTRAAASLYRLLLPYGSFMQSIRPKG